MPLESLLVVCKGLSLVTSVGVKIDPSLLVPMELKIENLYLSIVNKVLMIRYIRGYIANHFC